MRIRGPARQGHRSNLMHDRIPSLSAPQLRRGGWTSLDGDWQFALDPDARWRPPDEVEWDRDDPRPVRPGDGRQRRPRDRLLQGVLVSPRTRPSRRRPPASGCYLHFGAVDYAATVWANGRAGRPPRGRVHAVHRRPDRHAAGGRGRGRGPGRGRPARPGQAPRQAGLAAPTRTPSGIPGRPASGRRSGWSRSRRPGSRRLRWTPTLERYEIGLEAWIDGDPRDDLRLRVVLTAGPVLLADDTYRVVAGEVHRRIALSDPGIDDYRNELLWSPDSPTLIRAHLQLLDGRRDRRRGVELHRPAVDRRAGRPVRPERPAAHPAAGARPGVLARDRADRPGRRGPAAGRGAGQGDGVQRRPQAPEDRGPAVPVLGRRARAPGVGGDAQRLPVHARHRSSG